MVVTLKKLAGALSAAYWESGGRGRIGQVLDSDYEGSTFEVKAFGGEFFGPEGTDC